MKIVIDEKIPYIADALTQMGYSVKAMPGDKIAKEDVRNAGALFVRTRTKCNAALLDDTAVRFIGTATIGYDHIDAEYCRSKGIEWVSAPGCNADAVLQYVQSVVYSWLNKYNRSMETLTIGVVGVGNIGTRVERWARSVGMTVLLNDPPRASSGEKGFVSIDEIAEKSDIVTFHPSLTTSGEHSSYHLLSASFLKKLTRCSLLINASRGAVADNAALLAALKANDSLDLALDVWEGEPHINLELLDKAYIATPHIAGYSAKGKLNASRMMLEAFARFVSYRGVIPEIALSRPDNYKVHAKTLSDALLSIYSPLGDTAALKAAPKGFELQRNEYKLRREPSEFEIYIDSEPCM